jgi:hypothetical protein
MRVNDDDDDDGREWDERGTKEDMNEKNMKEDIKA